MRVMVTAATTVVQDPAAAVRAAAAAVRAAAAAATRKTQNLCSSTLSGAESARQQHLLAVRLLLAMSMQQGILPQLQGAGRGQPQQPLRRQLRLLLARLLASSSSSRGKRVQPARGV
jgi:hypothetical protein